MLGMMAKNVLRKAIARKLRIFPGKFKKNCISTEKSILANNKTVFPGEKHLHEDILPPGTLSIL